MYKNIFIIILLMNFSILNAYDTYKEKKIYPMGKKIFEKKCTTIDLNKYKNIDELTKDIKNKHLCKPLKDKYLNALTSYLWDVKRLDKLQIEEETIKVSKNDKCPICGMFIYKYPRWVAKLNSYLFDGVKDMMKFYFEKKDDIKITNILVTDYYTQKAIDAKKAFYVIGSDMYGPMGNELIPFKTELQAKTFYTDHFAKKILKFNEITEAEVYKLDE